MYFSALGTSRLILLPICWQDIHDIMALKSDVGAFSHMLGGVRTRLQVELEMAEDLQSWGQYRIGIYTVHEKKADGSLGQFLGLTGIHNRPDGRGFALRFALWAWARGKGYAREAASVVLNEAHARNLKRVIAITKESNIGSRRILGGIGMHVESSFIRDNHRMLLYVSEYV